MEWAFATKDKGKGKRPQKKVQGNNEDTSKNLKSIACQYCGKMGHMKKHCKKRLAKQKSNPGGPQLKAYIVEHSKESAFNAFMAKRPADQSKSSAWYIDFGAPRHFTHRKDWFTKYMACSNSVIFDGGEEYTIVGKGNVQITSRWKNFIFLNV